MRCTPAEPCSCSAQEATLYSSLNVLLLGIFAPALVVAWFAGAEKLARAAVSAWGPINLVFYPRINHLMTTDRKGAEHAARWSAWLMMAAGMAMGRSFPPPLC